MRRCVGLLAVAVLVVAAGCGPEEEASKPLESSTPTSTPPSATPPSATPASTSTTTTSAPAKKRVQVRGIDASHHQGPIDWSAVADDGISFAYLKATEGTSYTDPTFAQHRAQARELGIDVGGYHYFQLCSSGTEQAAHFASVLGDLSSRNQLPPAVDLELAGSCTTPPSRDVLLAEVVAFLEAVEAATGKEPAVYLFPEFEARFGFASELRGYRQWVRSLDGRPGRPWWIWQQTDTGTVAGIDGPVDVNVMWRR